MPGLDVYYAADGCFEDKAQNLRNSLYRRWGRYRHFAEYERAVFAKDAKTEVSDDLRSPAAAVHQVLRHAAGTLPPAAAGHRPGSSRARPMPTKSAPGFRAEFNLEDDDAAAGADRLRASRPRAWIAASRRWPHCPLI